MVTFIFPALRLGKTTYAKKKQKQKKTKFDGWYIWEKEKEEN